MKTSELRALTAEELAQRLDEARQESFNLRMQQANGQLEKPSRRRIVRREAARIRTLLRERGKEEGR